ncbi:MAG: DegV family protein [Ardenticatenaceae bacterium]|nr:DegV family protein [Ardenticatenaceae bacterium]
MIRIVTDSTCDLPDSVVDDHHIIVLPLYINIGKMAYLDGVEMSRQVFYQQLPTFNPHPTTAAPGTNVFRQAYQRLAEVGASQILSIHIAETLSATVNIARTAAKETTAVPVTVLDSGQLSLGMGFMVQTAAKAAAEGATMSEILHLLAEQGRRTHVFAVIDTLTYLRRSGRMNGVIAGIGSLLRIKPLLKMHQGIAESERVRTLSTAYQRLVHLLEDIGDIEKAALVHTHAAERAEALRQQAAYLLPGGEIPSVDITPVLGAHLGPNAVGFACIAAR